MNLPSNLFDGELNTQVFLCQPDKTIIGEIVAHDLNGNFKFNTYSEISFSIERYYNDMINGQTKINPYYDLIESLRVMYLRGVGHFIIQDVDEGITDNESKSITCFSLEYATGSKYLENFYVNTGEEDSIETMYHAKQHGAEYAIENNYKPANTFDAYERYYIKEYSSTTAFNYVEVQIIDENEFNNYDEQLYVKAYPNVRFYWPSNPELSLLHNVFDRIPEWKIGHVDKELWSQERTFSEDRTAVYDFLYNTAAETLKFVMVWDTINGVVNFYKTEEDGVTADEEIETQWNTDVFISRDNLASSIDIKYSTDDIKTKLKITGSDTLDIRDVNLGQNYVLNLSYYNTDLWLGKDLHQKYNKYIEFLDGQTDEYQGLMSTWAAANNEYNDLMNHVPVDPRVMLIGDEFEKLYCVYSKYRRTVLYDKNKTYYTYDKGRYTQVTPPPSQAEVEDDNNYYYIENIDAQVDTLHNKLTLYNVDQQEGGKPSQIANSEDVLLTLENDALDSATIRVGYDQDDTSDTPAYCVYRTLTNASTGISNITKFTLREWINGDITADHSRMNLSKFKIKEIGTLGAYFCLVRDEIKEADVEDYGVRLLMEKQDTYTKIFITQTEGFMNQKESQCVASDEAPPGEISEGTKWLDTDSENAQVYVYTNGNWVDYDNETHQNDYENYARFHENYQKLQVVQKVLADKQLKADYLLNGVEIKGRYLTAENIILNNLLSVAQHYFTNENITVVNYDKVFGILIFTIGSDDFEYAVYTINGTPYVSYSHSQGVCLAKMNVISNQTNMYTYFTEEELVRLSPFIREDEYSDDNFLLTGYESEEEQMNIKQELLKSGQDELKKICQPKLSFDATMENILSIPEFQPLKKQFKLGNFIRVGIRDGYVKRARLLEVNINFDDLSDFNCTFGDLISTKSEIDKHADLLKQAVTVSKTVASNSGSWQKGADKASELDQAINDGLKDVALSVASSSGQNITWDQRGILGRKLVDGTSDVYEDEQFMLTNNKLVFTDDNWETSRAVIGKFEIKLPNDSGDTVKQSMYGLLADAVVGGYIQGSEIVGGSLEIGGDGGKFIVHPNGSVEIRTTDDKEVYASQNSIDLINQTLQYRIELISSGSTIFAEPNSSCEITCKVYKGDEDVTSQLPSSTIFTWLRDGVIYKTTSEPKIIITNNDISGSGQISCRVQI